MIKTINYFIGFVLVMLMLGNCQAQDTESVVVSVIYLFLIGTDIRDFQHVED